MRGTRRFTSKTWGVRERIRVESKRDREKMREQEEREGEREERKKNVREREWVGEGMARGLFYRRARAYRGMNMKGYNRDEGEYVEELE